MSSSGGKCNHKCGKNEYSEKQTLRVCRALANLIPCFKRRLSPTSSKCSSRTSKHNYFLENHFIVKCPKHAAAAKSKSKRDKPTNIALCRDRRDSPERTETTLNQLLPNVGKKIKLPQKEVKYITAKKKSDDNKKYINILGMEPCAYLDQFSSVFIKNLKDPVPKDPLALPRKYNVYIPPKRRYCQDKQPFKHGKLTQVLPAIEEKSSTSVSKKSFQVMIKEKYQNLKKNLRLKKTNDSYLKECKNKEGDELENLKEENSFLAMPEPAQKIKSSLKPGTAHTGFKECQFRDDKHKFGKHFRDEVMEHHQKGRHCNEHAFNQPKVRHRLINFNGKHCENKHQMEETESSSEERHHHFRRCHEDFNDKEKLRMKPPKMFHPRDGMCKKLHRTGEYNVMRCEIKNNNAFNRSRPEVGDGSFPNKLLVWKVVIKDEKNISTH